MRILFIGDVYGRSGREALQEHLPRLIKRLEPDVTIVNGENACHGRGINEKIAKQFFEQGADCITSGNHIWGQREVIPYIQAEKRLLRPINYPQGTAGNGVVKLTLTDGRKITVVNAMGRVFMDLMDCPFAAMDAVLKEERMGQNTDVIFVDFHAEATSEKMAMGHFLDGRVSAVVGTHTHVPTADTHILKNGTAYQTDAGMTGDYDSVIGAEKSGPVQKFIKGVAYERLTPAKNEGMVCGTFILTNDNTGLATAIEPVRVGEGLSPHIPEL